MELRPNYNFPELDKVQNDYLRELRTSKEVQECPDALHLLCPYEEGTDKYDEWMFCMENAVSINILYDLMNTRMTGKLSWKRNW